MATKPIFDDVKPWPSPSEPLAPRDHNKPPLEEVIPLEFREELLRERPEFLAKLDQFVDAADRAEAKDDETLGRCGDLVKGYRALIQHIDAAHKAVKQPYLDGGRLVDAEKNALTARVTAAKQKVEAIGNAFVAERNARIKAEQDRIAAEQRAAAELAAAAEREREEAEAVAIAALDSANTEAERQAAMEQVQAATAKAEEAMASASLAPAAAAKPEPVRSDAGATVSGKQEWKSEVTDFEVAFIAVSDNPKVREAIEKAVAQLVKAGKREIAGVRIWPVAKANFR